MESQHKYKRGAIALCCILLVFSFIVTNSHSTQEEKEEERLRNKKKNPSEWKLLSSLTISNYWEAIKNKYLAMAPSYASSFLSPPPKPNTDFRGKVDKEEGGAIGKSIEKAKETIEESAKSAAKMATDKLSTHPQDEL